MSYGSAGASLQQANAAVAVMKLAMDESGKAQETVKAYLEGMNETQKDYFSFQWQQAMKTALALLNGDEDAAILEDAGDADFDLKAVDSKKVAGVQRRRDSAAGRCRCDQRMEEPHRCGAFSLRHSHKINRSRSAPRLKFFWRGALPFFCPPTRERSR